MVIASIVLTLLGAIALAVHYSIVIPRQPFVGPLPELTDVEHCMAARLATHVRAVASRPHNIDHYPALEAAARYIETTLTGIGYVPTAQRYVVAGREVRNIEVVIAGPDAGPHTPTIVVGAHYDSPDDSPGANDNGTGVAALIEIARGLRGLDPRAHRLRLVFFVNEEHPYGKTPDMGSWRHARSLEDAGERVRGMIALETLGYFSDAPGSQQFPFPFGYVYPHVGNFVAFVGLPGSRRFLHQAIGAFRRETSFPSIGGVAPGFLEGIDLSDHWAYHQFAIPALMITDTAPFRNPYYHQRHDLPDTVDYESLARITGGLERMVRALVGR